MQCTELTPQTHLATVACPVRAGEDLSSCPVSGHVTIFVKSVYWVWKLAKPSTEHIVSDRIRYSIDMDNVVIISVAKQAKLRSSYMYISSLHFFYTFSLCTHSHTYPHARTQMHTYTHARTQVHAADKIK